MNDWFEDVEQKLIAIVLFARHLVHDHLQVVDFDSLEVQIDGKSRGNAHPKRSVSKCPLFLYFLKDC